MPDQNHPPHDSQPCRPVPLTTILEGAVATLQDVRDRESLVLLRALGLTRASRLRLCKSGDPYIVQVRATRIALSRVVAQCLYVLPDAGGSR